jgi:hypothetical protein
LFCDLKNFQEKIERDLTEESLCWFWMQVAIKFLLLFQLMLQCQYLFIFVYIWIFFSVSGINNFLNWTTYFS